MALRCHPLGFGPLRKGIAMQLNSYLQTAINVVVLVILVMYAFRLFLSLGGYMIRVSF